MASNAHIGELLKAEEEAQNTVQEARKRKSIITQVPAGPCFASCSKVLFCLACLEQLTHTPFFWSPFLSSRVPSITNKTEKTELLRQAKAEADREVNQYKQTLEQEYQQMLAQGSTDTGAALQRLNAETAKSIENMKARVQQKSGQVAQILVNHVKQV